MSVQQIEQLRQDCSLDSPRLVQFSGFLTMFLPSIILLTAYWFIRPSQVEIGRDGPLTLFLLLTLVESIFFVILMLITYPQPGMGTGSPVNVWAMTIFGTATYIGVLAIWKWRRWGLVVIQGVAVLITIYSGSGGINMLPAIVAIFNAFYLTLLLRRLRSHMV